MPPLENLRYYYLPMAQGTLERRQGEMKEDADAVQQKMLALQRTQLIDQYRGYFHETLNELKVAGEKETRDLEKWVIGTKATEDDVHALKEFWEKAIRQQLRSGRELRSEFDISMKNARQNKYISEKSLKKWLERFENRSVKYKDREKWVQNDMKPTIERWKAVAEERKLLIKKPEFVDAIAENPELKTLLDEEGFLNLHFDKRKDLLAEAKATMYAINTSRERLFTEAKSKLSDASSKGILYENKVGIWLERIFKSKASKALIEKFVMETGPKTLDGLKANWTAVRLRYDKVATQMKERDPDIAARGLTLKSPTEFLKMHYSERLTYVTDLESRLHSSENIENEKGVMLELRHAIDIKDWDMANELLIKAQTDPTLDIQDRSRLISMERQIKKDGSKETSGASLEQITNAKARIDRTMQIMQQTHPEMVPTIMRFLRGLHANRSIHQLRWTTYNNIWCRTNGPPYLDDDLARKGASEDSEQMTKFRAEQGLDVGRHDALNYETADTSYMRKKEDWEASSNKATYMHTNLASGGVMSAIGEFYEREQNPKRLYWTTMSFHVDGEPKGDNWHRELLHMLTELRSCTATLQKAGFRYAGPTEGLIGVH